MITFWNRKEVCMGISLNTLNRARDILEINRIDYDYKYGNLSALSMPGGFNNANSGEWYIYVNKKDVESASIALRDIEREPD